VRWPAADSNFNYEWADICGYPTNEDGQPLVVLEAMAADLPIGASRLSGIPDTIPLLVKPADSVAFASAAHSLIADTTLRLRLGAAARERFLVHYTLHAYLRRFADVFGEVLRLDGEPSAA
jgi:glycosyltransferase involved in cell wall biosynthesis